MTSLFGTTTPHPACQIEGTHFGHDLLTPDDREDYCRGRFVILDDYDSWILTQHPEDASAGWLEHAGWPNYEIESSRVHELDWQRQVEEKTWLESKTDFAAAWRAAKERWPA